MTGVVIRKVIDDEDGMRLDRWFKNHYPELAFGTLNKLLRKGNIRVSGARAKGDTRLTVGDEIRVPPIDDDPILKKRIFPLDEADQTYIKDIILFEDADMVVLNKPAGLPVQGGSKSNSRNFDDLIRSYYVDQEVVEPKLVHRLDKETSGVQIFAKNRKSASSLALQFKQKTIEKTYLCVTRGVPTASVGEIKKPLIKRKDKVYVDYEDGKWSLTDYEVIDTAGHRFALVEAKPKTGRTHQIRVHLASISTPILGDMKYNINFHDEGDRNLDDELNNLFLHAVMIDLKHPRTEQKMTFKADLPPHFEDLLSMLGF